MPQPPPDSRLQKRLDAFRAECAARGLKLTHQRSEIFRELAATDAHPDAETIHRGVRERIPTISPDTVYRNLKLLVDHGLATVVGVSRDRLRFDANVDPHHHFVCVRCGLIGDFEAPEFDGVAPPEGALAYGEPFGVQVEVKGVCRRCASERPHGVERPPHGRCASS